MMANVLANILSRHRFVEIMCECTAKINIFVTEGTEEAFGSICRLLFKGVVGNKHGSNIGKQVYIWQDKE